MSRIDFFITVNDKSLSSLSPNHAAVVTFRMCQSTEMMWCDEGIFSYLEG